MPSFSSPLEREAAVSTFVPPRAAFLSARRFNHICRSYQNFQRAQLAPLSPQEIQLGHLGGMCADYCSFLPAPDISGTRTGRLRRTHATAAAAAAEGGREDAHARTHRQTHTKQGRLWQDLPPTHHYTPVCNPTNPRQPPKSALRVVRPIHLAGPILPRPIRGKVGQSLPPSLQPRRRSRRM